MTSERVHTFLVQRRSGRNQRIFVWDTQDISVGRAPENDLVVDDVEASRQHARFVKGEDGFCVQNHSVSNPTFVNDEPKETQPLKDRDVVRIAETEFVFCQAARNPVTLGLPVEYASQLKAFGPKLAAGDGEATILGLMDSAPADEEGFVVRPAGDFEHDLHGVEQPRLRHLDAELSGEGAQDLEAPGEEALGAWAREERDAGRGLCLSLEVEGLTAAQRASLESLMGKLIEIPQLRIRLKGRDLD